MTETGQSSHFAEMIERIGMDVVPQEGLTQETLYKIAFELYVATNSVLEMEKVPRIFQEVGSYKENLSGYRGRVTALRGVLSILGQSEFVEANDQRAERIRQGFTAQNVA